MIEVPCSNFEWPIRFSDFNFCFFLYSIIISPIFVEKKIAGRKTKKGSLKRGSNQGPHAWETDALTITPWCRHDSQRRPRRFVSSRRMRAYNKNAASHRHRHESNLRAARTLSFVPKIRLISIKSIDSDFSLSFGVEILPYIA